MSKAPSDGSTPVTDDKQALEIDFAKKAANNAISALRDVKSEVVGFEDLSTEAVSAELGLFIGLSSSLIVFHQGGIFLEGMAAVAFTGAGTFLGSLIYRVTAGKADEIFRLEIKRLRENIKLSVENEVSAGDEEKKVLRDQRAKLVTAFNDRLLSRLSPFLLEGPPK